MDFYLTTRRGTAGHGTIESLVSRSLVSSVRIAHFVGSINERSRLNRSNGFNTIMKKNLTTYLVKELPTLFMAQRKPMVEADWFWLR